MIRKQAISGFAMVLLATLATTAQAAPEPYLEITNNFVFWGSYENCTYQFVLDGNWGRSNRLNNAV